MLFWLTTCWEKNWHILRVFHYLTFRSILSALTGLIIVLVLSPSFIRYMQSIQMGQAVRDDGPQSHLKKTGTPTMGGLIIVFAVLVSVLFWSNLANHFIWIALAVMLCFAGIGLVDDYRKVSKKNSKGLPGRWKYLWQTIVAMVIAVIIYSTAQVPAETQLFIPFLKDIAPNIGILSIALTYFVIVGSSNAVNLTDGLDGLALMPTVLITVALGVFAYLMGNVFFARYLAVPHIPQIGELVVFCSAMVGAGLGFLWYNAYPAQIFMGDVGSLSLGAVLGVLAVLVRQEILLFLMGGVFVAETLSVIIQVVYFKLTGGKRIFRMAPLHHHFELKGWPEPKVIVRFWIITVVLVLLGLATLKLR